MPRYNTLGTKPLTYQPLETANIQTNIQIKVTVKRFIEENCFDSTLPCHINLKQSFMFLMYWIK